MTDYKTLLLLASEMLNLASDEFSNHGCNDLDDKVVKMISPELCEEMKQWNSKGETSWPWSPESVGGSSLMHYLSYRLKEVAVEMDRDIKLTQIGIEDKKI